jgi:DNA repair exonuclease SbcCD nuclease subunit
MGKRIAIFSDLHLGVHQNNSNWHKIANDWSDWFVEQLHKHDLEDVFFLGDYFHSRSDISVNTLHVGSDITDKFKDFKLKMIVGNHCSFFKDRADIHSLSVFKGYSNIEIIDKPKLFNIDGKEVFMCPWGTNMDEIPSCDVLMGHFEIETFKMNAVKFCEDGFSATKLLKKSPLVFSGHFHLRDERVYKNGKIIYVGNPFEMDFGDSGDTKGFYILDFKDLNYEFVENNISPKHKKIKISDYNKSKNDIKNNIVKIIVDEKIEDGVYETISNSFSELEGLSLSFDNVFDEQLLMESEEEVDLSGIDVLQSIKDFVELMDIQNKEEVLKYTLELYSKV